MFRGGTPSSLAPRGRNGGIRCIDTSLGNLTDTSNDIATSQIHSNGLYFTCILDVSKKEYKMQGKM